MDAQGMLAPTVTDFLLTRGAPTMRARLEASKGLIISLSSS